MYQSIQAGRVRDFIINSSWAGVLRYREPKTTLLAPCSTGKNPLPYIRHDLSSVRPARGRYPTIPTLCRRIKLLMNAGNHTLNTCQDLRTVVVATSQATNYQENTASHHEDMTQEMLIVPIPQCLHEHISSMPHLHTRSTKRIHDIKPDRWLDECRSRRNPS